MNNLNSINNSGVPYYFPADIAKEGDQYVRISNFFKTRVGDNGKVLPFKWYDQGRVMNVHGCIPFIQGLIGKFSTDENDEVIMASDASYREWQGSTANAHDGGFIDYILEDQMFPQEGIFKGHFGLKDGNGNVLTSVNIIFEVLGNDLRVGETVKYYVAELENLKNQYKIDGEQAIDDLYQKYQNDVVQVQNALHTNNASLDALSTTVKGLNANIQANNVVTRPEFDRLSNEIVTRLSQMNTTPDYYENYNSMIAANPNGTQNLCVTSDNQHKWLYINSKWVDLGDFSYAGIAPQLKQDLYSGDHDNALINPDLKNDAYNWTRDSKWDVDPAHAIGNSMAYGCLVQNAAEDENHAFFQKDISVTKRSVLSCGVKVNTKGLNQGALQLLFRDASNEVIDSAVFKVQLPTDTYADYKQIKLENIAIPANAETAAFSVVMENGCNGLLVFCQPQINFDSTLSPYTISDLKISDKITDNILSNPDFKNSAANWGRTSSKWELDTEHSINNSMAYGIYLTTVPDNPETFYQKNISVAKHSTLSCGLKVNTNTLQFAQVQLLFRDVSSTVIDSAVFTVQLPTNTYADYKQIKLENIAIPANAETAAFSVAMQGTGLLIICQPQMNFGSSLLPYSLNDLTNEKTDHDNLLTNPDLKNNAVTWTKDPEWELDTEHSINNSKAYGINLTSAPNSPKTFYQANIPVAKQKRISCGVLANALNNAGSVIQLLFRDANNTVIDSAVFTNAIPTNTGGKAVLIKLENIAIPANAETAAFSVAMQGTGVLVICRPQMNFGSSLLPYSLNDVVNKNDTFGNLPYFNFGISKDTVGEKWVKAPFTYHRESTTIRGFAQIAIQGDSSRAYPKKNYKIKLFSDEDCQTKFKIRLKLNWAKTNKFNLKANWIDASQSRNLVNASLMANATSVTEFAKSEVEDKLSYTQSYGQMEGFPGLVQFNGMSNGLYSFNTKKDDIIFGMDGIEKTAAIAVLDNEKAPASQRLVVPSAKLDNVAYADELHDTPDPELVTNWSKWLDFLNNSTDDDFKTKVSNYIDLNAAINIYLFGVMSREYDYYSKSILFLTWDNGNYFYPIAYDLDSTWGQNVTGAIEGNPQDENWGFSTERSDSADGKYVSNAGWNKLFERLYKLFKPEIKRQYQHLRSTVWRTDQILNQFKNYMSEIPEEAIEYDHELWNIPSADTNNYEQLHHVITQRSNQMDRWINHLEE